MAVRREVRHRGLPTQASLSRSHPLSRDLRIAAVATPADRGARNLAVGGASSTRAAEVWPHLGWRFSSSLPELTFSTPVTSWTLARFTVAMVFTVGTSADSKILWSCDSGANDGLRASCASNGGITLTFGNNSETTVLAGALTPNARVAAVFTFVQGTGLEVQLRANGGPLQRGTNSNGIIPLGTPSRFTVSSSLFSNAFWFQGSIASAYVASRVWSDHEARIFLTNPWAILTPQVRRVPLGVIPLGGGGTDYDLTADTVSYGATATSASLLVSRRVDAQPVTYTATPTAASLLAARRLTADPVAYAWTPAAASVVTARRLAADTVAATWTPTAASLLRASRLAVESVAYAWTPSAATLFKQGDYDLVADPVAYDWTPTAATLAATRRLACDGVTFGAAATDATLRAARRLDAATVAYAWAPTAASLTRGQRFTADPVAYQWAPTDASLRAVRRVSAETVGYLWTPTAASLSYTGAPSYGAIVIGAARAGVATFTARAGVARPSVRSHLTE